MIGMLRGVVALRMDPYLIVDVNGVGYKVHASSNVLSKLQALGEEIKLFIHTHVREDTLDLYGFASYEDLRLFEYLIDVSGVGCRSAIGIFSVGSGSDAINAIVKGDATFFTAVPRLGKKNAQKIIIELRNKLGSIGELNLGTMESPENNDVIAALQGFGFSPQEAKSAFRAIDSDGKSTAEKIRLALKQLGK